MANEYYQSQYDGRSRFGSKQPQDVANWGYIILYLVVILGSFIGNGLFLFTIKKNQNLRRSHHFLLASLAIRDLIVTVLVIPFAIDSQVVKLLEWTSGDVLCKFYTFMNQATIAVHGFTLTFLLLSLYIWYRKNEGYMTEEGQTVIRKTGMHKWSIPLVWVIASGLAITTGAMAGVHFNTSTQAQMCLVWDGRNSNSAGYKITMSLFFVIFVLPIIVVTFPFIALSMQVCGCREPRLDRPHSRTALTGLILFVLYGVTLGPFQVYEAMKLFQTVAGPMRSQSQTWGTPYAQWTVNTDVLLNAMIYVACVIHPIVYFAVNPEYRSGLVVAWKNLYCNKDPVQREREDAVKRQRRAMQRQYPGRQQPQTPIIRNHGEPLIHQTQPQIMSSGLGQGHHYPYSQGYQQPGTLQGYQHSGTLQPLLPPQSHHQMLLPDQHFIDTSFESALTGTVSPQLPPVFEYDGLKYIDTARVEPKMGYSPEKTPSKTPETPHFDKKPFDGQYADGQCSNMFINPETGITTIPMQIQQQPTHQQFEMIDMSAPIATSEWKEEERRKRSSMEIEQMESSPGNTLRDRNRRQQYSLSPPVSPTGDVSPLPVVEVLQESPGNRNRRRTVEPRPEGKKPLISRPYTNGTNISSSQPSLGASSAGGERSASRNSAVEIVITGRTRSRTDLCPEVPKSKFEHSV